MQRHRSASVSPYIFASKPILGSVDSPSMISFTTTRSGRKVGGPEPEASDQLFSLSATKRFAHKSLSYLRKVPSMVEENSTIKR